MSAGNGAYIAGPMRGVRHCGHEAFHAAQAWLDVNTDFSPIFSPAAHNEAGGFLPIEWDLTGHEDLAKPVRAEAFLLPGGGTLTYNFDIQAAIDADNAFIESSECAVVVMLPGWSRSEGALEEKKLAERLGKRVLYLIDDPDGPEGRRLWHVPMERDVVETCCQEPLPFVPFGGSPHVDTAVMDEVEDWWHITNPVAETGALDGEVRTTSETGGAKCVKPEELALIPGEFMDVLGRVMHYGAQSKYGPNNWRKGFEWMKAYNALLRHVFAPLKGEWIDPDSGQPHLGHAAAQIAFLTTWATDPAMVEQFNDIYGLEVPE